jgi:hypothetical protein
MAAEPPELTISPEKVCFILLLAREFDEKVEPTDPDSGSNPGDDGEVDVLEYTADDSIEEQLRAALFGLNEDERLDLIALVWLGRGDFSLGEWDEARQSARDITRERTGRYIAGIPLVSDYLEDGLSDFGFSLADYVDEHQL